MGPVSTTFSVHGPHETFADRLFAAADDWANVHDELLGLVVVWLGAGQAVAGAWADVQVLRESREIEVMECAPGLTVSPRVQEEIWEAGLRGLWLRHTDGWATRYSPEGPPSGERFPSPPT